MNIAFYGAHDGALSRFLQRCGVPLQEGDGTHATGLLLIDADSLFTSDVTAVKRQIEAVIGQGGTALIALGGGRETLSLVNTQLPTPIALTARQATMLVLKSPDPWTQPLVLPDLYFAEDPEKRIYRIKKI